jgi:hypothetical protein
MSNFDKIIGEKLWNLTETTITPSKPTTAPTTAPSPRKAPSEPNPFKRPGHSPFTKPKPKADSSGDKVASFLTKRINAKLKKYK